MQLPLQIAFRENPKEFEHLKDHSYFFKELNRGSMDYKMFVARMKEIYKERATDKISSVVENMDLIKSVLDVLK